MAEVDIVATEGTVGGKHRIEGTRIRVIDVIECYQELGWDIEKIVQEFGITPQQVLAATKFYYDSRKTVRNELLSEGENVNA